MPRGVQLKPAAYVASVVTARPHAGSILSAPVPLDQDAVRPDQTATVGGGRTRAPSFRDWICPTDFGARESHPKPLCCIPQYPGPFASDHACIVYPKVLHRVRWVVWARHPSLLGWHGSLRLQLGHVLILNVPQISHAQSVASPGECRIPSHGEFRSPPRRWACGDQTRTDVRLRMYPLESPED